MVYGQYKRKTRGPSTSMAVRKTPYKKPRVVPGRTRTAGYYGRFVGPSPVELKFFDLNLTQAAPMPVNGLFVMAPGSIVQIPAGTGESDRIGRKATIKKVEIKYRFTVGVAGGTTATIGTNAPAQEFRVILFLDKQCNGAAANAGQIIDPLGGPLSNNFPNLENAARFVILADKMHLVPFRTVVADNVTAPSTSFFTMPLAVQGSIAKYCNIPIEWSANTGAIAEIRSNNIGVMIGSLNGGAPLNDSFTARVRVRYDDQ